MQRHRKLAAKIMISTIVLIFLFTTISSIVLYVSSPVTPDATQNLTGTDISTWVINAATWDAQ
jgi:hypothetical protein